ncbi:MAG: glycosyltransferase family 2 protein [Oscillospiraceae bacterium]|nr:glycosyltransferase family 2 protein [Oscillospiraceae bacterium]
MNILYLVIPCYNEEEVIEHTSSILIDKLDSLIEKNKISEKSKIMLVDDGSKDKTWEIISKLNKENKKIIGLKLSRNKGHQNALLAGLMTARKHCDVTISLDSDLQDDISAIDKFYEEFEKGNEIVYGVRSSRKKDTFFKKHSALAFYKIMNKLGVDIVHNHADYRLMSKKALDSLSEYEESNLFLRGIIPLIGYKSSIVKYIRNERFAGTSKYPLKKMISFALDGITSFSIKPIRLIFSLGVIIFILSTIICIYSIIAKFIGQTVDGWTTIVASIWMIGGIQLLCIGALGEYIGKIYNEVKKRPRFILEKFLNDDDLEKKDKEVD